MEPATLPNRTRWDEYQPFNIVIAYDNGQSARHAIRLVNALAGKFGREFEIQRDLWRFDALALPKMGWLAARSAASANILIIAAEGDGELPVAVRTWLEEWSDNTRPGMAALAALLRERSPSADAEPATLRFLRDLAERAGLEFFVGEFPASRTTSSPSLWFEPGATLDARPARQSSLVSP